MVTETRRTHLDYEISVTELYMRYLWRILNLENVCFSIKNQGVTK